MWDGFESVVCLILCLIMPSVFWIINSVSWCRMLLLHLVLIQQQILLLDYAVVEIVLVHQDWLFYYSSHSVGPEADWWRNFVSNLEGELVGDYYTTDWDLFVHLFRYKWCVCYRSDTHVPFPFVFRFSALKRHLRKQN